MTEKEIQQREQELAAAAKALEIPAQTTDEAIDFMAGFLPKISNYSGDIRLLVFGIACYNAGKEAANK